jgi:hypothetical protein
MKTIKVCFGIALIISGIALALYLGLWLCFIGGIVQAVEAIKMDPVDAWGIAFGALRFACTGVVTAFTIVFTSLVGAAFFKSGV